MSDAVDALRYDFLPDRNNNPLPYPPRSKRNTGAHSVSPSFYATIPVPRKTTLPTAERVRDAKSEFPVHPAIDIAGFAPLAG